MVMQAGELNERFSIEQASETRNTLGETVQTWTEAGKRWGSYEAVSYTEQLDRDQIGGTVSAVVRIRYFEGLTGKHRLKWLSRDNRILYISSVIEKGNKVEHELAVEERAT